jgi:hypothetical protein
MLVKLVISFTIKSKTLNCDWKQITTRLFVGLDRRFSCLLRNKINFEKNYKTEIELLTIVNYFGILSAFKGFTEASLCLNCWKSFLEFDDHFPEISETHFEIIKHWWFKVASNRRTSEQFRDVKRINYILFKITSTWFT